MHTTSLIALLALAAGTTTAAPLQPRSPGTLTAAAITALDPTTSSCASAPAAGECRTAAVAAPAIAISFANFGIATFGAQAALLALMLHETAGFKYSRNHYPAPGRPGQGTRNMQMPEYNVEYARWLATTCANCGVSAAQVQQAEAEGPDSVLALVNTDQWSFGSAAWYLDTQCDGQVKAGLGRGDEAGWAAFLTGCVGTTVTEERTAIWRKAMAMGQW